MGWNGAGIQLDVVPSAVPVVAGSGEEVVHLVGPVVDKSERFEVELDPSRVGVMGVQIHDGDDGISPISARFTVRDDLVVVDGMKAQTRILLQGLMGAADSIDTSNELR